MNTLNSFKPNIVGGIDVNALINVHNGDHVLSVSAPFESVLRMRRGERTLGRLYFWQFHSSTRTDPRSLGIKEMYSVVVDVYLGLRNTSFCSHQSSTAVGAGVRLSSRDTRDSQLTFG